MDMDWSFTDSEDFGLAKSFSNTPVHAIHPEISGGKQFTAVEETDQAEQALTNEIRSDGFNFKLAAVEDQVHF